MSDRQISIGLTNDFQVATGQKLDRNAFREAAKKMGMTPRIIEENGVEVENTEADGRNIDIHVDEDNVVTDIVIGWLDQQP